MSVPSPENLRSYLDKTGAEQLNFERYPFAIYSNTSKKVIGSTSFYNFDYGNKNLMIGYTWLAQSFHKTGVNREMKYLMLRLAFEELGMIAVRFETHSENKRSRKAIEGLGASLDGILRSHKILKDGSIRDSAHYSITMSDWNSLKFKLDFRQNR